MTDEETTDEETSDEPATDEREANEIPFTKGCYLCQHREIAEPTWNSVPDGQQTCPAHVDLQIALNGAVPARKAIIYTDI